MLRSILAIVFPLRSNFLKISEIHKYEVAKLIFYHHHQHLFPLLSNLFTKTSQVSQKSTRLSKPTNNPTLHIPVYKKQSDFRKALRTNKVLKFATKFQQALKSNNLLKALMYDIKIIY